uniref:Uncharacterized protein n=1 Tax=Oryza rufipogon TaxID=4529 RepID=A0A0E0QD10_ORYRU
MAVERDGTRTGLTAVEGQAWRTALLPPRRRRHTEVAPTTKSTYTWRQQVELHPPQMAFL